MKKTVRRIELVMIGSFGLHQISQGKFKARGTGPHEGRSFTLQQESEGRWRVSGISLRGSQLRKRFDALGLTEAVEESAKTLYQQTNLTQEHPELDLAEAFDRALAELGGGEKHRYEMTRGAGYFIDWAERNNIKIWRHVTYELARKYMMSMAERGLRKKTISHYLQPLRVTSRFINATFPDYYHDVTRTLRIPHSLGRRERKWSVVYGNPALTYKEVLEFLEWLEGYEHGEILIPGVMLQGLMGLQLMEALHLQWDNVDLVEGTITIEDIDEHLLKNDERCRRLPMPDVVAHYFEAMPQRQNRVLPYRGDYKAYGKLLKRALKRWDSECRITPKDLRNTLQDHAEKNRWTKFYWERFVGHAARDISGKHYVGSEAAKLTEDFRTEITEKINQLVEEHFADRPKRSILARFSTFVGKQENPEKFSSPRIIEVTALAAG